MFTKETASEAGKLGGQAVKAKFGVGYYKDIGKVGGNRTLELYGPEHFQKIGMRSKRGRNKE